MIDSKTKQKLLQELEKDGNVYISCIKTGISKATYYRWRGGDAGFRKKTDKVVRMGRENMSDIAEHALFINVKKGKMDAIKYALSHLSPRYRPKEKRAYIIHSHEKENGTATTLAEKEREREYYDGYADALKGYAEHDLVKIKARHERSGEESSRLPQELLHEVALDLVHDDEEDSGDKGEEGGVFR